MKGAEDTLTIRGASPVAPEELRYDDRGLLPVVVQDETGGTVLMVAWADVEAVRRTLGTRRAHFFSRSRGQLWKKGETSGNELEVVEVRADCDGDTLLVRARPLGPTCHTGARSCFDGDDDPVASSIELGWLEAVVAERASRSGEEAGSSYTARLLAEGVGRVAQKVGEEAVETVVASLGEDREELLDESADLLFHLLVLWRAKGIGGREVAERLGSRHRARTGGSAS